MAILLALIPFFTWAFSDVFGTFASRKIGNIPVNFFFLVFSFLLVSLYVPFAGSLGSWFYFSIALLLGAIHVIGLLAYLRALRKGNASLVGAIVGSFSVMIVVISLIVFKESLNLYQALGVLLCLLGLMLTSFKRQALRDVSSKNLFHPGVGLAFITFLSWGLYFSLIRIPVEKIGWFWSLYPSTFYFLPLFFFPVIRQKLSQVRLNKRIIIQILVMAVLGRTGDFAYNLALLHGFSSVVGAIAGVSPVFFVLLTRFIFKEPLTRQQKIGIVSSLTGITIIAFASI